MIELTEDERAILVQRTAALARREGDRGVTGEPAIFFRVGRQRCCALARSVRAVVKLEGMAPIPHGGRSVAGAIVRSGNVIPVFHLSALLSERIGRLPETAHALLLGDGHEQAALAVDVLEGFGEVVRASLEPPPNDVRSPWLTGTTADGQTFVDLDALRDGPTLWVDTGINQTGPR